jgi:hypothetical protein
MEKKEISKCCKTSQCTPTEIDSFKVGMVKNELSRSKSTDMHLLPLGGTTLVYSMSKSKIDEKIGYQNLEDWDLFETCYGDLIELDHGWEYIGINGSSDYSSFQTHGGHFARAMSHASPSCSCFEPEREPRLELKSDRHNVLQVCKDTGERNVVRLIKYWEAS